MGLGRRVPLEITSKFFRTVAENRGWVVEHGPSYHANPAGTVVRSAYERIKGNILSAVRDVLPVDALVLGLHGAMFADGYPDPEGDLLTAVRDIVGPDVPIGIELDSHCHLTKKMVSNADIIVIFKEWPHTDMLEIAEEVVNLTIDTAEGKINPHMVMFDCRMIRVIDTSKEPGRTLVDDINELEGKDGVLSISIGHSFEYADFPEVGNKVLVITNNEPEKGARLAEEIGRRVFDLRYDLAPNYTELEDALDIMEEAKEFPIVVAESYDVMAGGATGDSTYLLRGLIERGIKNVLIGHYWDPMAVAIALKAGEGTKLLMRIGGKSGPLSGYPVDMEVEILKVIRDFNVKDGAEEEYFGDVAMVEGHGIKIILNAKHDVEPSQKYFELLGCDPYDSNILVIKSGVVRPNPDGSSRGALYLNVDGPGLTSSDLKYYTYRNIGRPKWPFDENPFG